MTIPIPAGTTFAAPGLAPTRAELGNGVVYLGKETRTTPAVAVLLSLRSGAVCDPPDAPGAMWLLSRVIDRGTTARSAADIADELDSRGVSLSVHLTRYVLSIGCTCLAEDYEAVIALLGEMLRAPSLPAKEIAVRKGEVVTAIRQDLDSPLVRASEALLGLVYPNGHPCGRPIKGSTASVEALGRESLVCLHEARIAPSVLTAVVVGDVSPARAQDAVVRAFGDWRRERPPVPTPASPPESRGRQRLVIPMPNKAQADIAYGFTSLRRADPAYYAFLLANHAFGQYAIGGRLGDSIRERQGMAYYVSSSFDAGPIEGPLIINAGVSPANVDRAVASIDEEVARLVDAGLTAEELEASRGYLIGAMPRTLETNAGIASFLAQVEFFGLGLDYDTRMPDLLRAVSLQEANAAARRVLDVGRAAVVIAGPYQEA